MEHSRFEKKNQDESGELQKVQHRQIYWVDVPLSRELLEIDDEEVVDLYGVPRDIIFLNVRQEIEMETACLTIPFAVAFLIKKARMHRIVATRCPTPIPPCSMLPSVHTS